MTQEEKDLLLKDLCSRLPYNVRVQVIEVSDFTNEYLPPKIKTVDYLLLGKLSAVVKGYRKDEIKPYLFPLSSMTEEQEQEWYQTWVQPMLERLSPNTRKEDLILQAKAQWFGTDWLNENHFDYRGLIPADAAIDATGLDIY